MTDDELIEELADPSDRVDARDRKCASLPPDHEAWECET